MLLERVQKCQLSREPRPTVESVQLLQVARIDVHSLGHVQLRP